MQKNRKRSKFDTFAAFIDFKKAFDFVNWDFLLYKLLESNISGHMCNAIKPLYENTEICIQVNEHFTDWFPMLFGVRKETVYLLTYTTIQLI